MWPYLRDESAAARPGGDQLIYLSLELLIAVLSVGGNALVCWAVAINSNLQSVTNAFVVSLAVADVAVGLLAIPLAIAISFGFCTDFYGCLFVACFVVILTQSSIFSLLAIAIDRYIAIMNPLRYSVVVTAARAKAVVALCWSFSIAIGLTPLMGWNKGVNATAPAPAASRGCADGLTVCLFEKVVPMEYMIYFNFFCCVLLPLLVMLLIYARIFMAARRQLRLTSCKAANASSPGQSTSRQTRSILQKEVHAAKSLSIIVGLFAVCWLPLHAVNSFHFLCHGCPRVHVWLMNIAIILSHANSAVNPLIYACRLHEFRLTFRRILRQHVLAGCRRRRRAKPQGGDGTWSGRSTASVSVTKSSSQIHDDESLRSAAPGSHVDQ